MSDDAKMFGDTDDAALFGDAPKRKTYAAPKSFSADDQALGLELGAAKVPESNFARITSGRSEPHLYSQESIGPEAARLTGIEQGDRASEMFSQLGGQVAGSAVVPIGEGIGAPIGRKLLAGAPKLAGKLSGAAEGILPKTTDYIRNAIAHSTAELGKLGAAKAVASDVGSLAVKAGEAGVSAARAAAPAVATAAGGAAAVQGGPISNAVERLRASAAGNPRAAELMAKIQAAQQPPFPAPVQTGTVAQSTLGGSE